MHELTKRNETTAKQEGAVATRKAELATTPAVSTLAKAVRQKAETARKTMEKAAEAACTLESVKEALSQETQLVVDISESAKRAYDEGLIKFDTNKAGEMFAQLRDAGGRYGKKTPIKEKIVSQGLNPLEVQDAMRTQAIQEQLEQIVATLQEISEGVSEIKQGQHDDRLGLFLSGRALYLEACEISDQTMKKLLEAQALKSLSDANGQLSQSLSTDIKYLTEGKYKSRKTGQKAAIEERIASIRSALDTVNMSYALKAAIYYGNDETEAMLKCLEQYASFIGETIAPKSKKLAELDPTEHLPRGGFWTEKAQALEAVGNIRSLLAGPKEDMEIFALKTGEESNNGERQEN